MILKVEIEQREISGLLIEALKQRLGREVIGITLNVTAREDCRGEIIGHDVSATAIIGE